MIASRAIECGDHDVVVTGGVESMTRAPWVLPKPDRAFPARDVTAVSTTLGWRLVNPAMPKEWTVSLGEGNEQLREEFEISRARQDEFAARSHQMAHAAWESGFYDDLVTTVPGTDLTRDESIRPDSTPATLATLQPSFRKDGTITAGNASPLNDGAAALLLADEEGLRATGRQPLARVSATGVHALDPDYFGLAPVEAVNRALAKAGKGFDDLSVLELNEAFAAQVLGCVAEWPEFDPAILNPQGGAIALGHPLGASGARLAGTVAHQLARKGTGVGVATLCIGVGQGLALVLER
jgi:acetyl-CoA acyltransferase